MVSLTYEKMKNTKYLLDIKQRLQAWVIDDLFHRYTILKNYSQKEYFFLMKKIFQSLEIENINDEYWKSVYHFDGYLLVINNSFEAFNQQVFSKYLDIHKMEARLRSQIMDRDELQKNYAYTTTIFEQLRDSINALKSEVAKNYSVTNSSLNKAITQAKSFVDSAEINLKGAIKASVSDITIQTDEKISNVYSEITKNYDYTNNQTTDLKNLFFAQMDDKISWQNSQTDEKISRVYEEITKNYEYTNKLSNEAKELIVELDKVTDEKLSKVYEEIDNTYKRSEEFAHSRYKDVYGDVKDLSFVVYDEQMSKDALILELKEQLRIANERIDEIEKKLSK